MSPEVSVTTVEMVYMPARGAGDQEIDMVGRDGVLTVPISDDWPALSIALMAIV